MEISSLIISSSVDPFWGIGLFWKRFEALLDYGIRRSFSSFLLVHCVGRLRLRFLVFFYRFPVSYGIVKLTRSNMYQVLSVRPSSVSYLSGRMPDNDTISIHASAVNFAIHTHKI